MSSTAVYWAKYAAAYLLVCLLAAALPFHQGAAQQGAQTPGADPGQNPPVQAGQDSFDFDIGTWKTHISSRLKPLTGSNTWVEYDGTSVVHKLWDGGANLMELKADGPGGRLALASLRLYDPESHQWNLTVADSGADALCTAAVGGFKGGRGEFYDHETYDGRPIIVRIIISDITRNSAHIERAFSSDEGKTWEVNWVATNTRVADASEDALPGAAI